MKNYSRYLFITLLLFLPLSLCSCSYFKMTFQNEKKKILNKISPQPEYKTVETEDFYELSPRFSNYHKSLDDLVFDPVNGEVGLYFPSRFLKDIKNNFFMLDTDPAEKIPVVFVHGAGGTPDDWIYMISKMDRKIFTPIVYYYPSGIRLNNSAELLYKGIQEIHKKYGPAVLIAHSMGGLVARGAIRLLILDKKQDAVRLYISLSTPYGGHAEAQDGIEHLPETAIVPSWRDIASGSEYVKKLYMPPMDAGIDFRLFFGYRNPKKIRIGSNSDGSITIKSQLDFRAQNEAKKVYGFDDDHETILKDDKVITTINGILTETLKRVSALPE